MVREKHPRPPERHGEQRGERHLRHGVGGLPLCAGFHEGRHAGPGPGLDAPCHERFHDDDHDERGLSRRMLDDVRYHEEDDLCDHALYHELGHLSGHLSGHVPGHLSGHVSGRLSGHLFRRVSSHVPGCVSPGVHLVRRELYVVVRHDLGLYFPVHSSAHRPPRGLGQPIPLGIRQARQRPILEAIQPAEQRRVRLLKRLLEQRAVQRRMRLVIPVEIQVATQVPTRVPTPVATQRSIRSDEHREIRRETQGAFRRAFR